MENSNFQNEITVRPIARPQNQPAHVRNIVFNRGHLPPSSGDTDQQPKTKFKFNNTKVDHFRFANSKSAKARLQQQLADETNRNNPSPESTTGLPLILPAMASPNPAANNDNNSMYEHNQDEAKRTFLSTPYTTNSGLTSGQQKMTYLKKYVANNNMRSKSNASSAHVFADGNWNRIVTPSPHSSAATKSTGIYYPNVSNNQNSTTIIQSRLSPSYTSNIINNLNIINYANNNNNKTVSSTAANNNSNNSANLSSLKELSIIDLQFTSVGVAAPVGFQQPLVNRLRKSATKSRAATATSNGRHGVKNGNDVIVMSELGEAERNHLDGSDQQSSDFATKKTSRLLALLNTAIAASGGGKDAASNNGTVKEQELGQGLHATANPSHSGHFKALLSQQRKNKMNVNGIPIVSTLVNRGLDEHQRHYHQHHHLHQAAPLVNTNSLLIRRLKF
jgi:hypothetical protein